MNLEKLNLVELNAQESQEVEGGSPALSWYLIKSYCRVCDNVRNAGIQFGLGVMAGMGDGIRNGMS
jgi:hypothetical protein